MAGYVCVLEKSNTISFEQSVDVMGQSFCGFGHLVLSYHASQLIPHPIQKWLQQN